MVKSFNHTGLVVQNLDTSIGFYTEMMGMTYVTGAERRGGPISEVVGYPNTHLKFALLATSQGHQLELLQYIEPKPEQRVSDERKILGNAHVAFDVDDIDREYETLSSNGTKFLSPPVQVAPGKRVCYLQDPDGNWLELVELK